MRFVIRESFLSVAASGDEGTLQDVFLCVSNKIILSYF